MGLKSLYSRPPSTNARTRIMNELKFDVAGIGNALVDVIADADEKFLIANGIEKGAMTLIDAPRADALYARMGQAVEMSGGSCANTIAGLASLGGRGAFFGKVKTDQLGDVFAHDIKALGVAFPSPIAKDGPPTGRCLILVTPDAQRSMNTYLGAAQNLTPDDIDADIVKASFVTYMEGYLWDQPGAKQAFLKAAKIAREAGRIVSLTLSDSFCVGRYRDEFRGLVKDEVDLLFANEAEILSLYEVDLFDEALTRDLGVMDRTAFTLCMENRMPIMVFDMFVEGNMERGVRGDQIGTWVS